MRRLRESISDLGKAGLNRVDRDRGVIRGVKLVGMRSRNKRESKKGRAYTRGCLERARRLYEGVKVRVNHPKKLDQQLGEERDVDDTFGRIQNVRLEADGLYGDLKYLKSHAMAARVCEAAESMPTAYGLSHDVAKWVGDYDSEGVYVITEINQVDGVDLVDSPGTTSGLFESEGKRMKAKKKPAKKVTPRIKLDDLVARLEKKGALRESLEALREAGDMSGTMILDDGGDVEGSVNNAFMSACQAVLSGGGADRKAKLKKLDAIMEAQEKLVASGALSKAEPAPEPEAEEVETEGTEGEGDDEEEEDGKDYGKESLERENKTLKLRESCLRLAASMDVVPTEQQLKILERLDTDAERKSYLRESAAPRKTGSGQGGGEDKKRLDVKTFAERVTGRR